MYKVIYIDRYNGIKLVEQDVRPDRETVACFTDEDDLIPEVYLDPTSEAALETKRWAAKNEVQQKIFDKYYQCLSQAKA
jgi:hypothetical protein